jgi:hypothetical protein
LETPRNIPESTQDIPQNTPTAPTGGNPGETVGDFPDEESWEQAILEDVRAWRAGKLKTYSREEVERHLGLDR